MAVIRPFRGTRYNLERVPDLSRLIIPPYDVIPPEKREIFYGRDPYNFIHLELGREQPQDTLEDNRYTRAADTLRRWWQEGVLIRDEEPGFYYYAQEFQLPKRDLLMPDNATPQRLRRESFLCRVRLETLGRGSIFPHEQTLSKPKEDRLLLMKACGANLSPILAMYEDRRREVRTAFANAVQRPPALDVTDDDGVRHQMWRVTDSRILARVCEAFHPLSLYLLDGHHRYETALAYRDWRRQTDSAAEEAAFDYVLMCLTATDDRGLVVLPTHRLVFGLEPSRFRDLLACAGEFFFHQACSSSEELVARMFEGRKRRVIGVVQTSGYHLLTLKEPLVRDGTFAPPLQEPYGKLDIAILHALVLDRLLKISQEDQREQRSLSYVKGVDQVFEGVRSGRFQAGFLLNPTPVSTVRAFAEARAFMPQKSTYFYPKVAAGPVFYEF